MSSSIACTTCEEQIEGAFVRALGTVFHLHCFTCMDCGDVVASSFFPIDGQDGRQHPLCERDYFRRLNLICANCDMALRGSYITACNKKFHVEHFTCSLCSTLFGPKDSYYEHESDVYCHFHYSTRFATKCAGCNSAILNTFVEITRDMRDEHWHPECYMINKFWNVKVVSKRPTSLRFAADEAIEPAHVEEERRETPVSLRRKQDRMEQQVYRIWVTLSGFEESSAACISDMLEQVSNGQYLDAIRLAERFILHVEVLFAAIDDLEYHFARLHLKGMSHVREARLLCSKTVDLFALLSHTQETGTRRMGMKEELLAIVTGLAHYFKILIRIALTGALELEKEHNVGEAMTSFLDKVHSLSVHGANPSARRMIKGQDGKTSANGGNHGTRAVTYGFQSLAPENAGDPPFREGASNPSSSHVPSDLCVKCNLTIEEDCVRLGTYQRWHSKCVQCAHCGKMAAVPLPKEPYANGKELGAKTQPPKWSHSRRPPANAGVFMYDPEYRQETPSFGEVPTVILCTNHAHAGCRGGFKPVERLEQYAFLLNIALRRLYLLLKKQGVIPLSPVLVSARYSPSRQSSDPHRRKATVHLDRKLSGTARVPKRSTIAESPSGKLTHVSDTTSSNRHLDQIARQGAQQVNPSAYPQSYQGDIHTSRYSTPTLNKSPIDPTNQASGQVTRPTIARKNTEDSIVSVSDYGSPSPEPFIPLVGPGNYRRPPTRPGTPRPVHVPPLERLGGYRDDAPGPIAVVHPNSSTEDMPLADIPQLVETAQARERQQSPVPDVEEKMTLADIPQIVEPAQVQRSFVVEEGKEATSFEETLGQETRRFEQDQIVASREKKEREEELEPRENEIGQVTRLTIARKNTEDSILDGSDYGSPTRPGTPQPVLVPPVERLGGYWDDGLGPMPDGRPNSSPEGITLADIPKLVEPAQAREQQRSPVFDDEESMTLVDIPQIVEPAQVREQQRSPVSDDEGMTLVDIPQIVEPVQVQGSYAFEEGKEAKTLEETFGQETRRFEQDQMVARRGEKEREGEPELRENEIVILYSEPEQAELRRREDEVQHRQTVNEEEANREEAADKEQERRQGEPEERIPQLLVEPVEEDGVRFKEATHGGAERSQTEQEPTKRFSSYKLSNFLHLKWASRTRASLRSSFNFSARTSISCSTVPEQGDGGIVDWERRQEEIYERQREQFRQEQERFESCQ